MLNADGYRIRGFSKDDAVVIKGDSLRHIVTWKDRDIRKLPAGNYRVRLHLENAEVNAAIIKKGGLHCEALWPGTALRNIVEINSAFAIKANYSRNEKVKFYALYLNPEKP